MSRYRAGADFERAVKKHLEARGALVVRSAGSKGPIDLVAFWRVGIPCAAADLVQCKTSGRISKADVWALTELAAQYGAVPVVASKGPRGEPVLTVLERTEKAA